jgi:hypothetical protein
MAGLTVLITNNTLAPRAGTEMYVRDLALGLQRRGHSPVVYTTRAGEVARELRRATVPAAEYLRRVVTDVRREREALREQWAAFQASPTNRLRRRLLRAPLLGPLAQSLACKLSR